MFVYEREIFLIPYLTNPSAMLELQNPSYDIPELDKICGPHDCNGKAGQVYSVGMSFFLIVSV